MRQEPSQHRASYSQRKSGPLVTGVLQLLGLSAQEAPIFRDLGISGLGDLRP